VNGDGDLGAVGERRPQVAFAVDDLCAVDDFTVDAEHRLVDHDPPLVELELDRVPRMLCAEALNPDHVTSDYYVSLTNVTRKDGKTSAGRPRDPSIDRAIIDACAELLGEVGRSRLSREQIARRAGVSLPAVNRRYGSVDDILLAIAETPMYAPGSLPATPNLRGHLVARLTRTAQTLERLPVRRSAAELVAAATGDRRIDAAFAASLATVRAETLRYVDQARERGELAVDTNGELLLDLVDGALYYRLLWRNEPLTEAEVEPLVDTVLAGFAA